MDIVVTEDIHAPSSVLSSKTKARDERRPNNAQRHIIRMARREMFSYVMFRIVTGTI